MTVHFQPVNVADVADVGDGGVVRVAATVIGLTDENYACVPPCAGIRTMTPQMIAWGLMWTSQPPAGQIYQRWAFPGIWPQLQQLPGCFVAVDHQRMKDKCQQMVWLIR